LVFEGLLQKWEKKNAIDGFPTYDVVLTDPREILEGVPVVVGGYSGAVGTIVNVLNPFGYWESQGFGASLSNTSGMPWPLVRDAINVLTNSPANSPFGGAFVYRGKTYGLDLSQLPQPPASYRVGGGTYIYLMDMIAQLCDDGGADFFVELTGQTIRIRTVSRRTQPVLGTIAQVANTNTGNIVRSGNGLEARNEVTGIFLVGGPLTDLYLTDTLQSFWGYDISGNPILGTPGVFNITQNQPNQKQPVGQLLQAVPCEFMNLNATPVADIIGQVFYPCSTMELRTAKGNFNTWATFMVHCRPDFATRIGIPASFKNLGVFGAFVKPNIVNDAKANAVQLNQSMNAIRMYEFVKGFADEYMGRKFAVSLPLVQFKQDVDTGKISTSYEVAADGAYLPEGSAPLDLSPLNEDIFQNPDGRFKCFVQFQDLNNVDFSLISPNGTVVQDEVLYVEAQIDPNLIYIPSPAAVITIQPLLEEAGSPWGDMTVMAAMLQMNQPDAQNILKKSQYGNVAVRVAPNYKVPDNIAVPLRSTILTYGPWFLGGAPGKVRFDQDPSLVPWEYGGFTALQAAALARVTQGVTNMQVSEQGYLELAGPPIASLGDLMQAGGPNITDIQVSYGTNAVTTSYAFRTYTPRFGVFAKGASDRIRKLSQANADVRRTFKSAFREAQAKDEVIRTADRAAIAFLANAPPAIKRESPHDVLVGYTFTDVDASGDVRSGISSATFEEAVAFADPDDGAYNTQTVMSLGGLVHAFTTKEGGATPLPGLVAPTISATLDKNGLNPFGSGNDVEVYTWGDTYVGLHAYRRGADYSNSRLFGLRGPLVVNGWGYDWDGQPVPGDGAGNFISNYRKRSDLWKAGPVDHIWDNRRGVWTSHDVLKGRTVGSLAAHATASGAVTVYKNGSSTSWTLGAYNWGGSPIGTGVDVLCLYDVLDNRWYASATSTTNVGGTGQFVFKSNTFTTSVLNDQVYIDINWGVPAAYSVLYSQDGITYVWSNSPNIKKAQLGNATLGSGQLSLNGGGSGSFILMGGRSASGDVTTVMPTGDPNQGDIPRVTGWDTTNRIAQLAWFACPGGASGHYTGQQDIVVDTYCSGSSLVVTKKTFYWNDGVLVNVV
jgi:hypothetical protein